MQKVASLNECISHYSFNRTWCPSNSLSSPAVYSGCTEITRMNIEGREMPTLYIREGMCFLL